MLGEAVEDYLKAIWKLERRGRVTTSALAAELGVSPASVTGMLKKLAALRLVAHERYRGATLTSGSGLLITRTRRRQIGGSPIW